MAATETGFASPVTGSWRALGRMRAYQVPVVLGGLLAAFVGALTWVFDIANGAALATLGAIYMIAFGVVGVFGYHASKTNVQNGSLVAAIAGLALVALVGGTVGLFAGLLLLVGAIWGLTASR